MRNDLFIKRLVKQINKKHKPKQSRVGRPKTSKIPTEMTGRDRLREAVRIRDNYTCQICGHVWDPKERRLDVHHMDEDKEGDVGRSYQNSKDSWRMITLCHKCHLNLGHLKKKMSIAQNQK